MRICRASQGRHNWKAGLNAAQTRLDEEFRLGITDPAYNAACLSGSDPVPLAGPQRSVAMRRRGLLAANPAFLSSLLPYDLSRGGRLYQFRGSATIHQLALFGQDSITLGALTLNLGVRFDRYHGLTGRHKPSQPRGAFSYLFKANQDGDPRRLQPHHGNPHQREPGGSPVPPAPAASPATCSREPREQRPIALGSRNQYDAGIQQSLGKWALVDVSYFRKYTRNAFDFDALFSTPVTFPIGWKQSKLDGSSRPHQHRGDPRPALLRHHGPRQRAVLRPGNGRHRFQLEPDSWRLPPGSRPGVSAERERSLSEEPRTAGGPISPGATTAAWWWARSTT